MAGEAGGDGAVEDVEAEGDAGRAGRRPRRSRAGAWAPPRAAAARSSPAPRASPPCRGRACRRSRSRRRRPRRRASADSRRRSSWTPPWTIPKTAWRAGPFSRVPVEAAVEPAVGALGRAGGVVAVGVEGRALVEDEGDVGAERRLHLHRDLGRDEQLGRRRGRSGSATPSSPIETTEPWLAAGPPAALDLVGDAAVGEREDLEAAGVGDQRPLPAHEPVQPAGGGDPLRPGRDEQVVGVAEHHLVAELGDLARFERRAPSPWSPAG